MSSCSSRRFAIASQHRDDLRLVLVGDGTRRPQCEAAVPEALRDRVVFAGLQMELKARADYLASGAVVAFTARICSHPQTLIEAMAAGRPVVAYEIEGVRELVQNGRQGYLVPVGDAAALAAALVRVIDAPPAEQELMGERSGLQVPALRLAASRAAHRARLPVPPRRPAPANRLPGP